MLRKSTALAILLLIMPGCAKINSTAISYPSTDAQRLFIWKSNYSAGMGTNSGICAQGALTAFSSNVTGSIPIKGVLEADVGVTNSVSNINATNNQTAYANISLFYFCQIALNSMKVTEEKQGCEHDPKTGKLIGCTTLITTREPTLVPEKLVAMWTASANAISRINGANFPPPSPTQAVEGMPTTQNGAGKPEQPTVTEPKKQ